jgi:hypothetical protein
MENEQKTCTVYFLRWEESEVGFTVRPDGFSFHLSKKDSESFVDEYWDGMPNEIPDEYSRPEISDKLYPIEVSENFFAKVKKSKNGIRSSEKHLQDAIKDVLTRDNVVEDKVVLTPA